MSFMRPLSQNTSRICILNFAKPFSTSSTSVNSQTTECGTREWLVILPDSQGVLQKRLEIRPKHSPNFVRLHREGWTSWAGPIFDKQATKAVSRRLFVGSVMVVHSESTDAILEVLKQDIYAKHNIWDFGKAEIMPFRTRHRRL